MSEKGVFRPLFEILCGRCEDLDQFGHDCKVALAEFKRIGWRKLPKEGWVCPKCLGKAQAPVSDKPPDDVAWTLLLDRYRAGTFDPHRFNWATQQEAPSEERGPRTSIYVMGDGAEQVVHCFTFFLDEATLTEKIKQIFGVSRVLRGVG